MRNGKLWLLVLAGLAIMMVLVVQRQMSVPKDHDDKDAGIKVVSGDGRAFRQRTPQSQSQTLHADVVAMQDGVDRAVSSSAEAKRLHEDLAAPVSDATASNSERRVASAVMAGSPMASVAQELEVRCSPTVCEVSGLSTEGQARVSSDLANPLWLDTLPRLGYSPGPIVAVPEGGRTRFVQYLLRQR